jgi:hypothetical protein
MTLQALSGRGVVSSAAVIGAVLALAPAPARACGGMLFENHAERQGGMDGQEMFLSFGPDATVMVLSARFADASGEKAFLVPLRAVPDEVLDADAALFVALENQTVPVVTISQSSGDEGGGLGCGAASRSGEAAGGGGDFGGGASDVDVLDRGSTATYDWVVVGGDTGTALADWLDMAGFSVPAGYQAALDAYAGDGWYFLAAKLTSTADAGNLAPLELRLPAMPPATMPIPFGIGGYALPPDTGLDITLYVAATGQVLPQNYAVGTIDQARLRATSETTSNYGELFLELVETEPTFVLEYSYGEWASQDLSNWLSGDEELGIGVDPDAEVDPEWLADFADRLDLQEGRLARLRTRVAAADLVDLQLDAAAAIDVDRSFHVEWSERSASAATRPTELAALGLLVPLGLLRRRRR